MRIATDLAIAINFLRLSNNTIIKKSRSIVAHGIIKKIISSTKTPEKHNCRHHHKLSEPIGEKMSALNLPWISIVICTHNRASKISETIPKFLELKCDKSWELIIIDNSSTDHTQEVLQYLSLNHPSLITSVCPIPGSGAARDHGWRLARGKYVIFTDDDCYPDSNFLSRYQSVFEAYPDCSFFAGRILLWDQGDAQVTIDNRSEPQYFRAGVLPKPGQWQGGNIAARLDALQAIGGIDHCLGAGTAYPCEDVEMVARGLAQGFNGVFHPGPLVFHHHQRKDAEVGNVLAGYAKGRGAYYMRFTLDEKTRQVAMRAWYWRLRAAVRDAVRLRNISLLREPFIEIKSGLRYLISGSYARRPRPLCSRNGAQV